MSLLTVKNFMRTPRALLLSAGINSRAFEILRSVMNCEPRFCPGFILGTPIFNVPKIGMPTSKSAWIRAYNSSFSKVQLVQSIFDIITSRMLNKNNQEILRDMLALIPSK